MGNFFGDRMVVLGGCLVNAGVSALSPNPDRLFNWKSGNGLALRGESPIYLGHPSGSLHIAEM
jgi:hypothetical protein